MVRAFWYHDSCQCWFLSLGATLRAGPQQLLAEIGLQCGFTTGENFFEILNTLIINQQRNRRARLPHVWHLLRPRARSFLSLLLEQLPYCKFPWSLNIAHHLNSSTASQTTECYNISVWRFRYLARFPWVPNFLLIRMLTLFLHLLLQVPSVTVREVFDWNIVKSHVALDHSLNFLFIVRFVTHTYETKYRSSVVYSWSLHHCHGHENCTGVNICWNICMKSSQ